MQYGLLFGQVVNNAIQYNAIVFYWNHHKKFAYHDSLGLQLKKLQNLVYCLTDKSKQYSVNKIITKQIKIYTNLTITIYKPQ